MENTNTTTVPYTGSAKVIDVIPAKEIRFKQGLSEEELARAVLITLKVQPDDASFREAFVDLEFSDREGKGNFAGMKQSEITMRQASSAGLMTNNDVTTLFDSIGKSVSIYQKITIGKDGKEYTNTYLSGSQNRISKEEAIAKLNLLFGKCGATSAPKVEASSNPFA